MVPMNLEIEDPLEDEYGPLNKRPKLFGQWGYGANALLEEPPLRLRLRKSPSLLDLIQAKLSQASASTAEATQSQNLDSTAITDKLKAKASNFAASLLRIGKWERESRYEGDLVAKCYFAKRKLVWEVLEGVLKSKIEIQWSDIVALKASCPEDGPGTLNVVLARPPLFFRETDPQPRKHTSWRATDDFTNGQASAHRIHFLECPQGLLNKHFDNLIQCDARLSSLSRQPEMVLDSPYFESRASRGFDNVDSGKGSAASIFLDAVSPTTSQSSSLITGRSEPSGMGLERRSREAPSPGSAVSESPKRWEKMKAPSMSTSDLMNQLEDCISEHMTEEGSDCKEMLEGIAEYLLGDTQLTPALDERLVSRVNSLCRLLQKDPSVPNLQAYGEGNDDSQGEQAPEAGGHESTGMTRIDSFNELLLHLPRITSLPKLIFDISEGDG